MTRLIGSRTKRWGELPHSSGVSRPGSTRVRTSHIGKGCTAFLRHSECWAGCFSQTAKHSVVGSVLIERYRQCNPSPSLKCEKANNIRGLARDARGHRHCNTAVLQRLCRLGEVQHLESVQARKVRLGGHPAERPCGSDRQ